MNTVAVGQRWEPIDPYGCFPIVIVEDFGDSVITREVSAAKLRTGKTKAHVVENYRRVTNPAHN